MTSHALGIDGLTPGAVGIILTMIGLSIIWFIRGMADRKRAANEEITTLSGATDTVIEILTAEVKRLSEQVEKLTKQVSSLEKELHEERQSKLGVIRASAQNDISTAKVLKGINK